MFLILIALLFLPGLSLGWLSPLTEFLHTWCLDRVLSYTAQTEIHSALICGKRLPLESSVRKIFTDVGLIHLMVVSGAHLIFLEKTLNTLPKWPYKNISTIFCLIFYSLIAELHPPIFRALISFFLSAFSKKFQLHWNPYWRVMFSGMICIIFNPEWISSVSLQLSWAGALAFSYKHSRLMAQILSYMLILPLISQWTSLHPLSIALNWIFFPLISITLFPLSVLSFICPLFYPFTQFLWNLLIQLLAFLQPIFETVPFYIQPIPFSFRWIYIGIIFLLFQAVEKILYQWKT